MITKNDCLSILVKLGDGGVAGVDGQIRKLLTAHGDIPLDVLKFISDNRGFEVSKFYEVLRVSHNKKKSPLYVNILKDDIKPKDVLTTLSSLLTQIELYGSKLDDQMPFLREVRAEEIATTLAEYYRTGVYDKCSELLKLIRSDLLVLEYIAGKRELA